MSTVKATYIQHPSASSPNFTLAADGSVSGGAGLGGLVLLSETTIGSAVTSFTVSNAFSADYENYKLILNGGVASASSDGSFTFPSVTTGYFNGGIYNSYASATPSGYAVNNSASTGTVWAYSPNGIDCVLDIYQPYLGKPTSFNYFASRMNSSATRWSGSGFCDSTAGHTDITFTTQGGDTVTGGTIRVYGYANG